MQLPNGNLLLAGSTSSGGVAVDFILARLLPNGSLDTTFGTGGYLRTDFATSADESHALAIAGPDRLLVAGFTGSAPDFGLARYIATTPVDLRTFSVE